MNRPPRSLLPTLALVALSVGCGEVAPAADARLDLYRERFRIGARALIGDDAPSAARGALPVTVELPLRASGETHVVDPKSGVWTTLRLDGASDAPALEIGDVTLYPGALPGADWIQRPIGVGVEDWVVFEERPAVEEVVYQLDPGGARGLRVVGGALELLDAGGVPRLRASPPFVVDAGSIGHPAALDVEGCAVDRDPRPPWSRPPIPPGAERCTVRVRWHVDAYPAALDPTWTSTGGMAEPRRRHTATALSSGEVLVAGGFGNLPDLGDPDGLSSAEVYSPAAEAFAMTGSMFLARGAHTATLLDGAPDEVLIVGGSDSVGSSSHDVAEAWDSATGTFGFVAFQVEGRADHTATLLPDGRVLVAGGYDFAQAAPIQAELFDPVGMTFSPAAPMVRGRTAHVAALLPGGDVLIAGGAGQLFATPEAEVFHPATGVFTPTKKMQEPRAFATATALPNGEVLVAGGGTLVEASATAEVYDPIAGSFVLVPGAMAIERGRHAAALRPSGDVLLVGGAQIQNIIAIPVIAVDLFDASAHDFASFQPPLPTALADLQATPIAFGHVLVTGGAGDNGGQLEAVAAASIYALVPGDPCSIDGDCASGHCDDGVCCTTECGEICSSCSAAVKGPGTTDGICEFITPAGAFTTAKCAGDSTITIQCDGQGNLTIGGVQSCGAYACGQDACGTSCTPPADGCSAIGWCNGAKCEDKKDDGQPCADSVECSSSVCADGVCCDQACTDQCEACDVTDHKGTCIPVVGPPHGPPRAACTGSGTPCVGACDGVHTAACVYPGTDVTCGDPACAEGELTEQVCDGGGLCQAETASCGGFVCEDAGTCRAKCTSNAECVEGFLCDPTGSCSAIAAACDDDRSLKERDGTIRDCFPYACEVDRCRTSCDTVRDCAAPRVCDASGACIERPPPSSEACDLSPGMKGARGSGLVLLWLLALRRRRRRGAGFVRYWRR